MRLGEICSLTRADFQNVVREGSDQSIPACIVTNTKNGKTLAYPLHGWPLEYIRSRVEQLDFQGERLFPGPHGGNARASIRRYLPRAVVAAGLEWGKYVRGDDGKARLDEKGNKLLNHRGVTFHTLRHSMASIALNNGISPEAIQELGNWKTRRVVENYAHLADENLISAAGRMAEIVAPATWAKKSAKGKLRTTV